MSDYTTEASVTCPLFDNGATVAATRSAAHDDAKPKQNARRAAAIESLRLAGTRGLTRHELAAMLELPLQSICPIALAVLRNGDAIEDGRKRATNTGSQAAVIVISEVA